MLSHYAFEYDYDTYRPCMHGSDCCDNDYCRCGQIQNEHIEEVPYDYMLGYIQEQTKGKKTKGSPIENYCIGRLFTIHKLWDKERYELHITGGYYGEEIDGISCHTLDECLKDVRTMLELKDNDKIRFVLEKEYGYLLPILENAKFILKTVKYSDILPPEDYRRVEGDSYHFNSAIAICKKIGTKYQIIDGHHRWGAAKDRKQVSVFVINDK